MGGETCGDVMKRLRSAANQEALALRPPLQLDLAPHPLPFYYLSVSCPKCGEPMEHTAGCVPTPTRITAMFYCEPCHHTWQFIGGLVAAFTTAAVPKPKPKADEIQCGTEQGYQLHRRRRKRGEPGGESCDPCKAAHRMYENDRVERQPQRKARYERQQAS